MIQLVAIGNHPNVNNQHYIADTVEDLSGIVDAAFGATAYVLEDGNTYIRNGAGSFEVLEDNCPPSLKGLVK